MLTINFNLLALLGQNLINLLLMCRKVINQIIPHLGLMFVLLV